MTHEAHPLSWPVGWKRTRVRSRSRFGPTTLAKACDAVLAELWRMGVGDWDVVISTNIELRRDGLPYSNRPAPDDPGVAVYFKLKGERRVLACDAWDKVEHNLRAIAKHIEALRGIDRWGVGSLERAFTAYAALPESPTTKPWRDVLELGHAPTVEDVKSAHRYMIAEAHPDKGGSHDQAAAINRARDEALEELCG